MTQETRDRSHVAMLYNSIAKLMRDWLITNQKNIASKDYSHILLTVVAMMASAQVRASALILDIPVEAAQRLFLDIMAKAHTEMPPIPK